MGGAPGVDADCFRRIKYFRNVKSQYPLRLVNHVERLELSADNARAIDYRCCAWPVRSAGSTKRTCSQLALAIDRDIAGRDRIECLCSGHGRAKSASDTSTIHSWRGIPVTRVRLHRDFSAPFSIAHVATMDVIADCGRPYGTHQLSPANAHCHHPLLWRWFRDRPTIWFDRHASVLRGNLRSSNYF